MFILEIDCCLIMLLTNNKLATKIFEKKSKYSLCLSVSLMESQVSRVTTSTAHGVLMRVSEYLLSLSQGIKVSGSLQGPGPELSTSQPANPGLAPATRHTLNTALWPSLGDHPNRKRFFRVF